MLRAGNDLDPVFAATMVALGEGMAASTAKANGWLRIPTPECGATTFPTMTSNTTEMLMDPDGIRFTLHPTPSSELLHLSF
jgi:hypothetical protein